MCFAQGRGKDRFKICYTTDMLITSLFSSAIRIFRRNAKRTLLTLLGTVVGTAILVIVMSVGEGLRQFVVDQLSTLSPQNIYVEIKAPSSVSSRGEGSVISALSITTLDDRDLEDFEEIPDVNSIMGWYNGQDKIQYERKSQTVTIFAVGEQYPQVMSVDAEYGEFFTKADNEGLRQVIVLGSQIAEDLSPKGKELILGKSVKLGARSFRVVGIAEEKGNLGFFDQDTVVMIPVNTGRKKLWGVDHYQALVVQVVDLNQIPRVVREIRRVLYRNHDIDSEDKEDFRISTYDQVMDIVGTVTGGINVLLIALASISLLVGGVGIMNVMYVTVTERTREIGLRKAVGAPPLIILLQFLIEAGLITLFGGILGSLLGILLSFLMSIGASSVGVDFAFIISWPSIGIAIFVAFMLGLIFGFAPARKASQLDSIESLRSE